MASKKPTKKLKKAKKLQRAKKLEPTKSLITSQTMGGGSQGRL